MGKTFGRSSFLLFHSMNSSTDRIVALYLITTGALILIFRETLSTFRLIAALHLVGATATAYLGYIRRTRMPGSVGFVHDWYPVMLLPVLYKEVEFLAEAFGNWGLTGRLQRIESTLFGGQPSLFLSEKLPSVVLSEFLHFCYFSYLLWVPVIGGYWYFTGKRVQFHKLLFLVFSTYAVNYLVYILFPVDSPFYLQPALGRPFEGHLFYDLVHFLSAHGGARGGAFPSSHVSISTVILLLTFQYEKRWAVWLLPVYGGLVFATVFGRFHYVVDVLAGWTLAFMIVGSYRLYERLR
jgi:membrane-associated phospholipid phosphatase